VCCSGSNRYSGYTQSSSWLLHTVQPSQQQAAIRVLPVRPVQAGNSKWKKRRKLKSAWKFSEAHGNNC